MVPKNERMSSPAMRMKSPAITLRVLPKRLARGGMKREKTAKEKRGMLVSSPARLLEMDILGLKMLEYFRKEEAQLTEDMARKRLWRTSRNL